MRSRAVAETAAIPWTSNSPNGYVENTDLVHKEKNSNSRDTKKEQNYITPCATPLRITANSENDCDWLLVHREKAIDERLEFEEKKNGICFGNRSRIISHISNTSRRYSVTARLGKF